MRLVCHLSKKESFLPRHATLSSVYDPSGALIDQALVIYFAAPRSFTGEEVVEIQCHGGLVVASMVLDALMKLGVRLAEPGEFSKRAFLNGRIDLTEAEAIAKLIEVKSVDAAKILAKQMKGELKSFVENIRDALIEILAFVEVNIDYAEEDLPLDLQDQMVEKLTVINHDLTKTLESSKRREGLINGFKVAIIGKPNVGKSSLLNTLLNFDRAIISEIAGTTRDTIEEEIKIGTHLVKIVDTAGIREATDTIERIGVERSKQAIDDSEIVVAMFDSSREDDIEDAQIIALLKNYKEHKKIVTVLNKCDLPVKFDTSMVEGAIHVSCKNSVQPIVKVLKEYLDTQSMDEGLMLTSKRQSHAVSEALVTIQNSVELLEAGDLELFAFELNLAINHISSITRPFDRDEILEKMFGSFCLGK